MLIFNYQSTKYSKLKIEKIKFDTNFINSKNMAILLFFHKYTVHVVQNH